MDDPQAMTSENTRRFAASILPICKPPTDSFARTSKVRLSTSARSSTGADLPDHTKYSELLSRAWP